MSQNNQPFPEQSEPNKLQGTTEYSAQKKKHPEDTRKSGDLPDEDMPSKIKPVAGKNESAHLTDRKGEEKKEDYINTDERRNDLNQRGL